MCMFVCAWPWIFLRSLKFFCFISCVFNCHTGFDVSLAILVRALNLCRINPIFFKKKLFLLSTINLRRFLCKIHRLPIFSFQRTLVDARIMNNIDSHLISKMSLRSAKEVGPVPHMLGTISLPSWRRRRRGDSGGNRRVHWSVRKQKPRARGSPFPCPGRDWMSPWHRRGSAGDCCLP